jgi:hypothetical protein
MASTKNAAIAIRFILDPLADIDGSTQNAFSRVFNRRVLTLSTPTGVGHARSGGHPTRPRISPRNVRFLSVVQVGMTRTMRISVLAGAIGGATLADR